MPSISKLSTKEIDKTISRIKEEYDHGIVHLGLSVSRKKGFEERLCSALRERTDMTLFLGVEIRVVLELLEEAKKLILNPPREPLPPKPVKSYADRVIEKLQARIKGYPTLDLGAYAQKSSDVEKLYGTLDWFSQNIWKDLYSLLIKKNPQPVLFRLDDELVALTSWQGKLPKILESYVTALSQDSSLSSLAKAQNRCLLAGAHFFHRMDVTMAELLSLAQENAWSRENPTAEEKVFLKKTTQFLNRVLDDFRLRDLKPAKE